MTPPDVLFCVEDREVLDDYLVFVVAVDALGPGVPGGDAPLGVEHEDGVILYPVDQEPEALYALAQALLVAPGFVRARFGPAPGSAQRLGQRTDQQSLQRKYEHRQERHTWPREGTYR